jgi:anti-sigma B factor antagonist
MNIEIRDEGGVSVLQLIGRLDTNTSPEAQKTLNEHIEGGASKLVLDFTQLDYISSAGLRILLATAKKLRGSKGEMRLTCLNETIQEIFDVSGFNAFLSVFGSLEEALSGM